MADLINGFDEDVFCDFVNDKFSGSFSKDLRDIPPTDAYPWESARQLGVVKSLPGPGGSNMPLLIVAAKFPDGAELTERSSRIKQFKFAKQILDDAMSNPAPGVEGVLSQGLFAFYDRHGNFRLSLVHGKAEGTKLVWSTAKRFSFHVEAGYPNKTFRDRSKLDWSSFEKLKEAFSVEKLTKEFYKRLFEWYQRAMDSDEVVFPNDIVKDKSGRRSVPGKKSRSCRRVCRGGTDGMTKELYIIGGSNGAGKTTFAKEFLPNYVHCPRFVNPQWSKA